MGVTFDGPVVVPAADPSDAERTARALARHLDGDGPAVVVYVVEKAGGAPDAVSVEQREEYAGEIFASARGPLEDAGVAVETEVLYGTDVVEAIFEAARDQDADAVAFLAREGNRLAELLTGDVARRMVKEASVPVVVLPRE